MNAIHQLVAGFAHGDAISNEALVMRRIFREWGYTANIYSETRRILPELRGEALDLLSHRDEIRSSDVVLLHLSIGSVVNEVFPELPGRKVILYHNITPPFYFKGIQEQIARNLEVGVQQARALAGAAEVVLADSRFNAAELLAMGYPTAQVLPLVLDLSSLRTRSNAKVLKQYRDGLVNVLFVGRCAPNKRLEDCLSAFYYFQRYVQPASRFIHVGSFAGMEQYHALLLTRIRELQLKHVELAGAVPQEDLNAFYKVSRIFLCMSDHEGFCIPLIEAMTQGVPIIAYEAAAVPETLDGAGILVRDKRYDLIAETMARLTEDDRLRQGVLQGQSERLARYEKRRLDEELKTLLAPVL